MSRYTVNDQDKYRLGIGYSDAWSEARDEAQDKVAGRYVDHLKSRSGLTVQTRQESV